MADEWDSVIDFGGGDWSSVVDFGNTAVVEPPAMGMADSLRARSEIPSPYDRIRQREDALRAQLKAQGVPDDQMEQAIYQANISDAARMGLEAQPRNFITESTPYRAGEAAVTSLRNNLASTTYGAISNVADAVGADSLAQSTDYLHDIAQGDKQLQAATQEHLNKKAWIGETLSSWTVGAGQAVGESMAIGATAGTPAGALKTIAGYFAANTFDDAVSEGKPIGEATAQALIEGAWTLLAGKIIGAPLERLAAGASGAKVGEGAVGALAKYVSQKLPIRKELAQLAIGPLAEAAEEWGTEISHWLVDVYNGRKPFTLNSMWESTKGVIGPALVSGGAAEGVPSGVRYVFDTLEARRKALPTISRAFEDAQEYEGDVPPSDRRGFSEATGKNHRNKEYREAFTAAVAANRAFAEDASATGEQGAEPDLRGPRLETKALTPDQLKQHNRELAQLRKVDPQTADELAKMYPQEAAQILSAAGEMAAAENEYLRNLQAQYREVIGDGRQAGAKSARAAKSAAKGNDETSIPRYDHISDRLHEPEYAELASEASKLGHGDINSGILELIAGGAARFEPTLKASDYAADQLEKYKQSTQGQPVVSPPTQEELANGNQVQTQGEVQGEGQTQGNAQGQEVLASEPQPVSQPVAVSQPTGPAAVIENHRQRAEQEFGVKIQTVEPSTADHQEAIELGKERGLTVVLFNQGEGGDGNLNGFAVPGGKIAFVRADHRGNALFGLIGHEASHATGFDAKTSAEEQLVDKYTQLYYDEAPPSIQEKMDADSEYARREGKSRLVQELFANKDFRNQLRGKMPSFWARIKRAIKQVLGSYTPKDRFAQEVLAEFGVKAKPTEAGAPLASITRREEDQTQTPAFKKWFGDSKIVGEDGKPLVVYHGGRSPFDEFQTSGGAYFSNTPHDTYAGGEGAHFKPVYLAAKNPLEYGPPMQVFASDISAAKAKGHDAIIQRSGDRMDVIVFDPTQIKSATGNRGTFDAKNPDIRASATRREEDQTQTPAFKKWFGDSKVVGDDGEPLVVYHGTNADFTEFDPKTIGKQFPRSSFAGHYLHSDPRFANRYAAGTVDPSKPAREGANLVPAYVSIKKPLVYSTDLISADSFLDSQQKRIANDLKGGVYDGIIVRRRKGDEWDHDVIVAFSPTQIKSATGNKGTFDPKNPDIRASATRREEDNPRKLANIAQTPREREYLAILDQLATEAGEPGVLHDEEVAAVVADRLANNYDGERANVVNMASSGKSLNEYETGIAKEIFQEEAFDALSSGDPQKLAQVSALRDAYRATGTTAARAFRLRQDPLNGKTIAEATPKQRQALLVDELFNRPGSEQKQRDKAAKAGNQSQVDALDQKHAKRLAKIEQQLAMLGLTLSDLPKIARDPTLTAKVRNQIQPTKATFFDKLFEFRSSLGLFSGPATQAANIAGNAFHGLYDYTIQAPTEAVLNEMMLRVGAGDIAGRRLGEFPYLWKGIMPGVMQGMRNAMQVMRTEIPVAAVDDKFDHPRGAIGGKFGRFVRGMGYTSLSAADEFFNTLFANIEVGGAAFRMGLLKGLSGQDLQDFIGQQTTTPGSLSWRIALKHASDLTFHQELHGAAGKALGAAHAIRNVLGMRWFIPVVSFPVKAAAVATRKAPITGDVAMLLKAYDNWQSGKPVMTGMSRRFAERAIAWGATMAILATNDPDDPWITGQSTAPPGTPKSSVKIRGQWLSYSRIEPFSAILGMMVDGINVARTGEPDKIASGLADIPLKQIASKTFLKGLSDVIDLAGLSKDSSDKVLDRAAQWGSRFGESFVPNFYRQLVGATRESRDQPKIWGTTTGEKLAMGGRRILTSSAPIQYDAKVDPWGRKIAKGEAPFWSAPYTDFAWRLISPVYQTSQQPTIGDRIYARYNALHPDQREQAPSTVLPYITILGQRYALSEAEYEEYQILAGTLADQAAERVSQLPGFNVEAPTEANMKLLEKAVDAAKNQARVRLRPKWRASRPVSPATRTAS